jgi:ribosomal protein S18 acetylase RimI-like enzyme
MALDSSSNAQKESTHHTININQMDGPTLYNLINRQQKQRTIDNNDEDVSFSTSSSSMIRNYEEMLTASAENNLSDGYYEPEVYFVATAMTSSSLNHTNIAIIEEEEEDDDVNNEALIIMGIIAIQLRYKSPLIAGPSSSSSTATTTTTSSSSPTTLSSSNGNKQEDNLPAAVTLPSPHYYILNLQVETEFQRCGVGMSLLSAAHEYTSCRKNKRIDEVENGDAVVSSSRSVKCSEDEDETVVMNRLKERQRNRRRKRKSSLSRFDENEKDDIVQTIPIVLSVDTDNIAALRLYEKFGFEYLEQNEVFCMMKFEE